ncbi:MAG: LysM peptidoglycan-binding domain-containing protein [Cyanobacteria bacterium]|nr:LysM peptidoglycan-binding domain-containing protein [Cyanobacteriota bacterium]
MPDTEFPIENLLLTGPDDGTNQLHTRAIHEVYNTTRIDWASAFSSMSRGDNLALDFLDGFILDDGDGAPMRTQDSPRDPNTTVVPTGGPTRDLHEARRLKKPDKHPSTHQRLGSPVDAARAIASDHPNAQELKPRSTAGETRNEPGSGVPTDRPYTPDPGSADRPGSDGRSNTPGDSSIDVPPINRAADRPPTLGRTGRAFRFQDNGGAQYTTREGDTLSGIVRDALIEHHRNPGYTPTAEEIARGVELLARQNNIQNPERLIPGQRIVIPPELIARTQAAERRQVTGGTDLVQNAGASDEFARELDRMTAELPASVRNLLRCNGYTIVAVGDMRDYDPVFAGQQPRGWGPGMSWSNADGLHDGEARLVVVSSRRRDSDGQYTDSNRTRGVFLHEIGHAVDAALGNFVRSEEFGAAYERDVAAMTPEQREQFAYLLQGYPSNREGRPNYAGRQETFAEVFAGICGTTANSSETEATLNAFPTVRRLMEARLGIERRPPS